MQTFFNPTTLDPRLITTFGASIKPAAEGSPIGFFGTGLKHSIATILRSGGSLTIETNEIKLGFVVKDEILRGETDPMIYIHSANVVTPCGFTTGLGRNWEPWMVFRELWSNCKDEGGSMAVPAVKPPNWTTITVIWDALDTVVQHKQNYILDTSPIETIPDELSIHPGSSSTVFYRGIAAGQLSAPARFTYNILSPCTMTEDRTIPEYTAKSRIARGLAKSTSEHVLKETLLARDLTLEHTLDYTYADAREPWLTAAHRFALSKRSELNHSARERVKLAKPASFLPAKEALSPVQTAMLLRARQFCSDLGYPITANIYLSSGIGQNILGTVIDGEIWLSPQVFSSGTKMVATTLLEEAIHAKTGVNDFTRKFQDILLGILGDFYETAKGAPM